MIPVSRTRASLHDMPAPAYRVEDRSILIPYYTRWFIAPALPWIPARLTPNMLSLAGHLCCLGAALVLLLGANAWPLAASALLLQGYVWFDNADGAHARRTRQTSTTGEYLDHGLDLVNAVYSGVVGMYGLGRGGDTLGVIGMGAMCLATSITAWEQYETGTYRLGVVNQIESLAAVSGVLLVDAAFGIEVQERAKLFGVSLHYWVMLFVAVSWVFTVSGSIIRVLFARKSLVPVLGILALPGAVSVAHAMSCIPIVLAYAMCAVCTVAFGMRAFRARVRRESLGRVVSYGPAAAAAAMLGLLTIRAPASVTTALALLLTVVALGYCFVDAFAIARQAAANDG